MTAKTLKEFRRGLDPEEIEGEVKRTAGRPRTYDPKLADIIIEHVAAGGSVRRICDERDDLPSASTFHRWVVTQEGDIAERYRIAREVQARTMADDLIAIADDRTRDTGEDGRIAVQRDKLKLHARQWILGRVLAREYGDKGQIEHTHVVSNQPAIDYDKLSIAELEQLQALMAKAQSTEIDTGERQVKVIESTSTDVAEDDLGGA